MAEQSGFILPVSIISPTDVARLKREIDGIDNYFAQAQIREGGQQQVAMPRMSKLMDQLAAENKLNMLQNDHRAYVVKTLETLQVSAPVLHVSFSVDPPGSYVQKIVYWLRMNVHGQVLVTVGLQPILVLDVLFVPQTKYLILACVSILTRKEISLFKKCMKQFQRRQLF